MDISNNPFELGLDRLVDLTMDYNFIGKNALIKIKNTGIKKKFCGFEIDGRPLKNNNDEHIKILYNSKNVGYITSYVFSPRLNKNIAMGFLPVQYSELGFVANAAFEGKMRNIKVVSKPFYDPNKDIAKGLKT